MSYQGALRLLEYLQMQTARAPSLQVREGEERHGVGYAEGLVALRVLARGRGHRRLPARDVFLQAAAAAQRAAGPGG